jgi:hypothetical protein
VSRASSRGHRRGRWLLKTRGSAGGWAAQRADGRDSSIARMSAIASGARRGCATGPWRSAAAAARRSSSKLGSGQPGRSGGSRLSLGASLRAPARAAGLSVGAPKRRSGGAALPGATKRRSPSWGVRRQASQTGPKKPPRHGSRALQSLIRERLKGFEPSTFCMASSTRDSAQHGISLQIGRFCRASGCRQCPAFTAKSQELPD